MASTDVSVDSRDAVGRGAEDSLSEIVDQLSRVGIREFRNSAKMLHRIKTNGPVLLTPQRGSPGTVLIGLGHFVRLMDSLPKTEDTPLPAKNRCIRFNEVTTFLALELDEPLLVRAGSDGLAAVVMTVRQLRGVVDRLPAEERSRWFHPIKDERLRENLKQPRFDPAVLARLQGREIARS